MCQRIESVLATYEATFQVASSRISLVVIIASAVAERHPSIMATTLIKGSTKSAKPKSVSVTTLHDANEIPRAQDRVRVSLQGHSLPEQSHSH